MGPSSTSLHLNTHLIGNLTLASTLIYTTIEGNPSVHNNEDLKIVHTNTAQIEIYNKKTQIYIVCHLFPTSTITF